ncbi:MAG: PAS domain-containing protein [Oceanicaulis sp.]
MKDAGRTGAVRLEHILDSLDAFLVLLDAEGGVRALSAGAAQTLGGARDALIGTRFADASGLATEPDGSGDFTSALARAHRGEQVRLKVRLPRGEALTLSLAPVFADNGAVAEILVTGEEHAPSLSEAQAARGLAELESLYDALPVGVALHDREMRFLRVNARMAEIDGLPVEAHIGRKGDELLPGVDPAVTPLIKSIFDTAEPVLGLEVKAEMPSQPGVLRDFVADYYPVMVDGEVAAVGTCVREVTAERRFDLRAVLDRTLALVAVIDPNGRIADVNAAAASLFGLDRKALAGASFSETLWARRGQSGALVRDAVNLALNGQGVRFDVEFESEAGPNGVIDLMLSPELDANGAVRRVIASAVDITERKQAAERIELLLQEVNHRSKNMLGLVQAVARQTRGADLADYRDKFLRRLAGLSAAQDLVTARDWGDVELGDLVDGQLGAFSAEIGRRIQIDGARDVRVSARAAQGLGMAIHELVTNACKYGALANAHGRVTLSWRCEPDGLSMDWIEQGGPEVAAPSGSGFGSVVIKTVVADALGGAVSVDYHRDGLRWRLTGGRAASGAANDRRPARARVLIVEDEALIAADLAYALTEAGFETVGPAATVAAALDLIARGDLDAAVLDVHLGEETAAPAAEALTARGTPFVTVSGVDARHRPDAMRDAPALTKPIDHEALARMLYGLTANR